LLARSTSTAAAEIEHLVGMQAQNHLDPYFGLWSRVENFEAAELSGLVSSRQALRVGLFRSTIHLVTARDCLAIRPIVDSVLARTFGSTSFAKDIEGLDRDAILTMARSLLEQRPRTRAELGPLLAELWPGRAPASLAQAATYLIPVVQVTPRGLWNQTGPAAWTTIESWLGKRWPSQAQTNADDLVIRYLAAFGPAAQKDIRIWSGLTGLAEAVKRLRPRLMTFRDEKGVELFDLPEAPRPDPETPAPARFLPEYDNLLLSHADRSRFFDPPLLPKGWIGNLLLDGRYAGSWKVTRSKGAAQLEIELGRKVGRRLQTEVVVEGEKLLRFTDPDSSGAVRVTVP
jgi:hypothetical protein